MEKHKTVASKETKESKLLEKNDAKKSVTTVSEPEVETPAEKTVHTKKRKLNLKKHRKSVVIVAAVVLALLGIAYFSRGVFVAAVVDGSPISRLSVIRELEKQAGQQALDRLVTQKLVDAEVARRHIVVSPSDIDDEIGKIEDQMVKQGATLQMALEQQGMTEEDLREQMLLQKQLEKILGDKINVADEDVAKYMEQSGGVTPSGMDSEDFKNQIREQLKGQKFNDEVGIWIAAAKSKASISYYVGYAAEADATILEGAADPEME